MKSAALRPLDSFASSLYVYMSNSSPKSTWDTSVRLPSPLQMPSNSTNAVVIAGESAARVTVTTLSSEVRSVTVEPSDPSVLPTRRTFLPANRDMSSPFTRGAGAEVSILRSWKEGRGRVSDRGRRGGGVRGRVQIAAVGTRRTIWCQVLKSGAGDVRAGGGGTLSGSRRVRAARTWSIRRSEVRVLKAQRGWRREI
eukprot:31499-Pelagococcus_subviridis.AAC.20